MRFRFRNYYVEIFINEDLLYEASVEFPQNGGVVTLDPKPTRAEAVLASWNFVEFVNVWENFLD